MFVRSSGSHYQKIFLDFFALFIPPGGSCFVLIVTVELILLQAQSSPPPLCHLAIRAMRQITERYALFTNMNKSMFWVNQICMLDETFANQGFFLFLCCSAVVDCFVCQRSQPAGQSAPYFFTVLSSHHSCTKTKKLSLSVLCPIWMMNRISNI